MDWLSVANKGSSVLSGSGLLNANLNSNKNPSTIQERLDAFGSGITGEDPIQKLIQTINASNKKGVISDINNWTNNPSINTKSDLLNAYDNLKPLETVKLDSFGRLLGDNLLASAQGAKQGLSAGGPWGALAGGILGGVTNLVNLGVQAHQNSEINNEIQEANSVKINGLSNRMKSINKVDNYFNKANVFAMGGNLTEFNTGGTHEQNPNGGIPQGIGANGNPNTVEQGEVKANTGSIKDYVFSNRIIPTKEELSAVNLPTKFFGKSLADIAKIVGKESSERPFDNISKRGLEDLLSRLKAIQEYKKVEMEKDQIKKTSDKFGISPDQTMSMLQEQPDQNKFDFGGDLNSLEFLNKYKKITTDSKLANYLKGTSVNEDSEIFNNNFMMNSPLYGGVGMLGYQLAKGVDYSNADKLANIKSGRLSVQPLRDYMKYTPVDNNIRTNAMLSDASNLRSRLMDSAGVNGAVARTSLLASNKELNSALGKAYYDDNNINFERRKIVSDFNRGTNQANSELDIKLGSLNAEIDARNNENLAKSILLREQLKSDYETGLSSTYSNIFQNMGELGKFKYNLNQLRSMFGGDFEYNSDGHFVVKPKK